MALTAAASNSAQALVLQLGHFLPSEDLNGLFLSTESLWGSCRWQHISLGGIDWPLASWSPGMLKTLISYSSSVANHNERPHGFSCCFLIDVCSILPLWLIGHMQLIIATATDWQSLEYWNCGKWLLIIVSQQPRVLGALTANLCSSQHDCLNSINWEDQRQNSKSDLFPDRLDRLHGEKALVSGKKEWIMVLTAGELAERVSSHFMKLNSPSPALRTGVSPLFKSIHNNIFSSSLRP